jgi:hypothetical protein
VNPEGQVDTHLDPHRRLEPRQLRQVLVLLQVLQGARQLQH